MEIIGFLLFLGWTYLVWRVAESAGHLNGGRDGARALARYAQHHNISSLDLLEADAEGLDIKKHWLNWIVVENCFHPINNGPSDALCLVLS